MSNEPLPSGIILELPTLLTEGDEVAIQGRQYVVIFAFFHPEEDVCKHLLIPL